MLDDLVESLLESIDVLPGSRRWETFFRLLFGAIGFVLGLAGMWQALFGLEGGLHLRLAAAAMAGSMAAFCLLNIALRRPTSWPWKAFALSLVGMFAGRILLGP